MRSVFHPKFPCPRNSRPALPHDVLQHRLAFVETCPRVFSFVRIFLTVKHYFSEHFLVSIFALFVSFSSLVVLAICCIKVTTRPTGFTRLRLCVGVVLTLVTSVIIETSFISAAIDTSTNVLCLLDAAVRHLK